MSRIKYLGSADRRSIPKGTNWKGRLPESTQKELVWSHENHFIVDTEEAELTDEQVQLILEDSNFRDVSDLKMIPQSISEQRRTGVTKVSADSVSEESSSGTSKKKATRTSGGGASATGEGATTAGGSTSGATTTGGTTTTGGSTSGGGV